MAPTPSGPAGLLVLAHLRCGYTYAQLAAGLGVGVATVHRYVAEAIEVLAALSPTLTTVARTAARKAFVILDGTLLPIDRIAADRPYYSGQHRKHGMNVQDTADPFGRLLWANRGRAPGAVLEADDGSGQRWFSKVAISRVPEALSAWPRAVAPDRAVNHPDS
ncbi:hypothetical protein GCM10010300_81020 [Streptomyces olivaceoviridis]|nr:hypothetical protein GCM10010300_81020 [Streptomyces olivaceoviridis]